jgi:hypothetical protein
LLLMDPNEYTNAAYLFGLFRYWVKLFKTKTNAAYLFGLFRYWVKLFKTKTNAAYLFGLFRYWVKFLSEGLRKKNNACR